MGDVINAGILGTWSYEGRSKSFAGRYVGLKNFSISIHQ